MAIYAIGDLHLSVAAKKPMDIFSGWDNHAEKLQENWNKKIAAEDTVILAGDTSWGMSLPQAVPDFRLIHNLPGQKLILKGNHDYWWASLTKMNTVLEEHGLTSIRFLHNNSYFVQGVHICGSRGWIFENGQPHDEKIIRREALRIEASLKSFAGQTLEPFLQLMHKYNVRRCYYGHIHGPAHKYAVEGRVQGIDFFMISSDYIEFDPVLVL